MRLFQRKFWSLLTLSVLASALVFTVGCGSDEDDEEEGGSPIGAPAIQPPVVRNTPSGFSSATLRLLQNTTPEARIIFEIGRYLQPSANDAVGVTERLSAIDDRVAELDTRHQDNARLCMAETPAAHTLPAALPSSNTYSGQFQCQENLDGGTGVAESAQVAFGVTDASFFLFERTGNSDNAVLAIGDMDGTGTEFWQLGATSSNQNYIHVRADDASGLEMTASGTDPSFVLSCGVHMKSNDTLIYVVGFDSVGGACATEATTLCVGATDLAETAVADCETAGLNTFTLATLTFAQANATTAADTIIHTPITGYVDFSSSAVVEDETE